MGNKFDSVPVEAATRILFQTEARFGEYEVLYQKWRWGEITAESVIFCSADIAGLKDDEDLLREVRSSPLVRSDSRFTVKRSDEFTFVNFNFEVDD